MGVLKTWDKSKQEWVATATAVPTHDSDVGAEVLLVASQTGSATATKVAFDTTVKDDDGMVSLANDNFTILESGWYTCNIAGRWLTTAVRTYHGIRVNDVFLEREQQTQNGPANYRYGVTTWQRWLEVGDVVHFTQHAEAGATYEGGRASVVLGGGIKGDKGEQGDTGEVPEAPQDGKIYGRMNGAWVEIV